MVSRLAASFGLTLLLYGVPALAGQETYHDPAPAITRILDAHPTPRVVVSPDHSRLLIMERAVLPPISEVAAPELRLAGVVLNPRTNAPARAELYTSLVLQPIQGETRRIVLPWQSRVSHVMWAPDSRTVAFTLVEPTGVSLWSAEASTGDIRLLLGPVLNAAFGNPCRWLPLSNGLLCSRVPADRSAPPANTVTGDFLQNPGHEALFDYYFESQLVVVPLSGEARPVGPRGLHASTAVSPDGRFLLVETLHGPWRGTSAWSGLPRRVEVWDFNGQSVREVADQGAGTGGPEGSGSPAAGPRDVAWRADAPATLVWFEVSKEGNSAASTAAGDRVMLWPAPFSGSPTTLTELGYRGVEVLWSSPTLAIVTERSDPSRRTRAWAVDPSHSEAPARLLVDRSGDDRLVESGQFLTAGAAEEGSLLLTSKDGRYAFRSGMTPAADGRRPILDQLELSSGNSLRLFRSEGPAYEVPVTVLDADARRILTRREAGNEPPNYFVRDLRKPARAQLTALTRFTDHAPEFAGVTTERITYTGSDRTVHNATLYLPPGYDRASGPVPLLLWAGSDQAAGAPNQFSRPSGASPLFLLLEGYGVVDWQALPAKGEGEALAGNARALVERLVALGVADRNRVAVGGEADGALVAAQLMGRPNLFKAGIALELSGIPTDSIRGPLLLVRGVGGGNQGATRQETERTFAAIPGSAEVRLVLLPGEAGGSRARESVGQVLYEMGLWMEKYLKR